MEFSIFQETRRGARKVNQDRLGYVYTRDAMCLVVCDGMGGHIGGEIAAHIAVRLIIERFEAEAKPSLASPVLFLQRSINAAHAALGDYAERFRMADTPRTTVVACIIQDGAAFWAHAGDSRLYVLRGGKVSNRTRDHSKVQYLIDNGIITSDEAGRHPDRNKVFSCLGGNIEPSIDFSPRFPLHHGDTIVMCTDGLWSAFLDSEVATGFAQGNVQSNASALLSEAEKRNGQDCDNLSAIALKWATASNTWHDHTTTQTETLALGEFSTQMQRTLTLADPESGRPELSEAEIEKAIQDITETLKKHGSPKP